MIEPNKTVWTYWSGDCPAFSRLCLETIRRHNPTARLVTPEVLQELGGHEILALSKQVDYSQASVLIRYWLLWKFGGAWIDADSVALAPLDLLDPLEDYDLVGCYNPESPDNWVRGIYPTCFAGRQASPLLEEALDECIGLVKRMAHGEELPYQETSVKVLGRIWRKYREEGRIKRYQHWRYYPVPWERAEETFLTHRVNHEDSLDWKPNAQVYHLSKSIAPAFVGLDEQAILTSRKFAAFLVQKALGLPPAVPPRTLEILSRLPPGLVHGAEIGVLGGTNARCMLQQRRDMTLICVDPWTDEGFYQRAQRRLKFAEGRAELRRCASLEAVSSVPDGSLDFVFLDPDHTYEAVFQDLPAWTPKLKRNPGGLFCGHDYGIPLELVDRVYGVKRAVDEWAAKLCRPVERGKDSTWFIQL